jgi:DNA polymerase-4
MGTQRALGRRTPRTWRALDEALLGLVDRLTRRLRAAHRVARTVTLRLRFDDFTRATRSHTLIEATAETRGLLAVARGLLAAAMPTIERKGITLIGISLGNLADADAVQLALPLDRRRAIDATVDRVRDEFGSTAITRGSLLGKDPGLTVPLLPD